jgi:hypothetical protein
VNGVAGNFLCKVCGILHFLGIKVGACKIQPIRPGGYYIIMELCYTIHTLWEELVYLSKQKDYSIVNAFEALHQKYGMHPLQDGSER